MELAICVVIAVFLYFALKLILSKKPKSQPDEYEGKKPLPIEGAYKKRWLLTYNEKDAFKKLQASAGEIGYTIFSKVRLLDLLEPVSGKNYRSYFYKVQAKHVDFVLLEKSSLLAASWNWMIVLMTQGSEKNGTPLWIKS